MGKIKIIDNKGNIEEVDYKENIKVVRHSASHILAQAVKKIYKDAKLAIGPSTDEGFYYDFDNVEIKQEDLKEIEKTMRKIIGQNKEITSYILSSGEAKEKMKDEPFKIEMIDDLGEVEKISFFDNGEFVDMCVGPHVLNRKDIGEIKLLSVTGAYWRGSEKNKMLTRIYGTAFETKQELDSYILAKEEAKKRDHNKLGRELGYFTTVEEIGQGLPLYMPNGARALQILQRFVEDEEYRRGYVYTKTPFMAKSDLYKLSGHWDHYKDGMFILQDGEDENNVFALRPMTCPFQFMIYNASMHSYRDLPIRYAETSTLFRNESSGEMHGMIRVRQFTISEGHVVVREDQIEEEFNGVLDLINYFMRVLDIDKDITYRFSKWDKNNRSKYIDNEKAWEKTESAMKVILDKAKINYTEVEGEAAFYGPKLDIQYKNVYGKEDTIITVQIDFALAERLSMTYVDSDGSKKIPYIIHRTSIGCYDRTLAILIEKHAGAMPLWLAPQQLVIATIAETHNEYAKEIKRLLEKEGFRVEADIANEKIGYKIREARLKKVPYILVVGDNEANDRTVSIKTRSGEDKGIMTIDELIIMLKGELSDTFNK